MKSQIKRNIVANYVGQGWSALAGFLFIPLYVRYLGVEAYGLVALFAALNVWLSLLDLGMTPALGREMSRSTAGVVEPEATRDLLRSLEWLALAAAVLVNAITAASARWIAEDWLRTENLDSDVVSQSVLMMGLVGSLRLIEGIYRSSLIGLQQQVLYNVVNGAAVALRAFGSLAVLAWVSPTVPAFLIWQGVVSLVSVASLAATTYSQLPPASRGGRFSPHAVSQVRKFAGGMALIAILSVALTQIDKLILSRLLGLREFATYSMATAVAWALALLIGPIAITAYPRLCGQAARGDMTEFAKTFHRAAQAVTVVAGSVGVVLVALAPSIVLLWTHDDALTQAISPIVRWLAVGTIFNCLVTIPYHAQLATGWTSLTVRVNTVAVLVIIPTMIAIVPHYGAIGAAWSWAALNAAYFLFSAQLMFRRILIGERKRWYWSDTIWPLAAGFATVCILMWLWPNPQPMIERALRLAALTLATITAAALAAPEVRRIVANLLVRRHPPKQSANR